jgi:hypothetical protein
MIGVIGAIEHRLRAFVVTENGVPTDALDGVTPKHPVGDAPLCTDGTRWSLTVRHRAGAGVGFRHGTWDSEPTPDVSILK